MKEYAPTEKEFLEWEQNYEDGDVIAVHCTDPWNWIDNVNQWGSGNKYPDKERYCHVEPIYDAESGLSIRANGNEVVRANIDDYRTLVFQKKRRLVIYRAMPIKTKEELETKYKKELDRLLYKKYDRKQIKGFIKTNLINFWKWLTRQKEIENSIGDTDKPVCSTVCFNADFAVGKYKICEGMNVENINPSNLMHDSTYVAIAAIG